MTQKHAIIELDFEHGHKITQHRVSYTLPENNTDKNLKFNSVPISFRIIYFCRVVSIFVILNGNL